VVERKQRRNNNRGRERRTKGGEKRRIKNEVEKKFLLELIKAHDLTQCVMQVGLESDAGKTQRCSDDGETRKTRKKRKKNTEKPMEPINK
jgi:hypothetical protein